MLSFDHFEWQKTHSKHSKAKTCHHTQTKQKQTKKEFCAKKTQHEDCEQLQHQETQ
jgi:hypothetical protein